VVPIIMGLLLKKEAVVGSSKVIIKKAGDSYPSETIFRLFGNNEPVLTNVLAYLLAINNTFCFEVIRPFIPKKTCLLFNDLEISRQCMASNTTSKARTDIEIVNPWNFHIIFEAKIGDTIPSFKQCRAYVDRFRRCRRKEAHKLILLVNDSRKGERARGSYVKRMPSLAGYIEILTWGEIKEIVLNLLKKGAFHSKYSVYFEDFLNFINRSYYMKSFAQEVMIVQVKDDWQYKSDAPPKLVGVTSSKAVFEKKMYAVKGAKIKSVLYLAFRYHGKLSHFARVREDQLYNDYMIFYLDKPLELQIKRLVPFCFRTSVQHSTIQKLLDPAITEFKDLIEEK